MYTESGAWQKFDLYFKELARKDTRFSILINQLRQHDPKLYEHSCAVARFCFGVISHLSQMGILTRKKELIRNLFVLCGLLHDIGMLLITDKLFEKFPEGEMRHGIIQNLHAFFGYTILLPLHPDIADIVYFHHHFSAKREFRAYVKPNERLVLNIYDPLEDASVAFPISVLTIAERQELSFTLVIIEYIVTEYFDKKIAVSLKVIDRLKKEFPHCQNAIEALRRLLEKTPAVKNSPPPIPKKL